MTADGAANIPYPGPRSFETAEKDLFFGRDREVPEIFSLLVAHRAVLLYAQSGAGKTSLLRAALVPLLEQEGFDVLPIARVQGAMPADFERSGGANIFAYNVLSAWSGASAQDAVWSALRMGDFLAARPRRTDARGAALPRIAIFDQFEELFTAYPQYWPQRKEFIRQLAAAADADPLLRLLFVIREDYLASLDPYLDPLPEQLSARYRLERLSADAAQRAVEGPLRDTARKYAPGVAQLLVKQLLTSRVQDASGGRIEVAEQYAEPVQLQVVCRSLWDKLPADVSLITAEQLQAFGDVDQALTEFYEKALAETAARAGVADGKLREFFSRHLITPAGTRGIVFQEKDSTGGIPNAAIRILEDKHHIVRADTRLGARWYELTHDRFIEPIRRSNDEWGRKESVLRARRRRRRDVAGALLAIVLVSIVVWTIQDRRTKNAREADQKELAAELQKRKAELEYENRVRLARQEAEQRMQLQLAAARAQQEQEGAVQRARAQAQHRALTVGQIEELRRSRPPKATREAILDSVANYLWSRRDEEELTKVLSRAGELYPAYYGVDEDALSTLLVVPQHAPWPLELHYNPLSDVNAGMVGYHWQAMAKAIARDWGVPVPSRLKFIEDKALAVHDFRLVARPADSDAHGAPRDATYTVRSEPDLVAVEDPGSDPAKRRLREFLMKHNAGKVAVNTEKIRRTYYWAPSWTQSVWKVAGHGSFKREGLIALAAAARLLDDPALMISSQSVGQILKRVAQRRPKTVEEALAARKGASGVATDLQGIVRRNIGLVHLDFMLDILADYPDRPSAEAVELAMTSQGGSAPVFPARLLGRRQGSAADAGSTLRSVTAYQFAYDEVGNWLPELEPPIRVHLGSALLERFSPREDLSPELREALTDLRGRMNRRFGFNPPGVRFRSDDTLLPNEFRVEILNQSHRDEDAKPVSTAPAQSLATLMKHLEFSYVSARVWWLDTDEVGRIMQYGVPDKLRDWLLQRYSLTDIKLLLQSQIAPDSREIDAYAARRDELGYRSIREEQSIRDTSWLLGSLVFRARMGVDQNLRAGVVDWLRRVQRTRFAAMRQKPATGAAIDQMRKGIARLVADDIDGASEAFGEAAAADRPAAAAAFLGLYAESINTSTRLALLEKDCRLPEMGRVARAAAPSISVRYEIERLLERTDDGMSTEQRRMLQLCLLQSYVGERHPNMAHALVARLEAQGSSAAWRPEEEYVLAALLLRLHGASMAEPGRLDAILNLLSSSVQRLPIKDADAVFEEVLRQYGRSPVWHAHLLMSLVDRRPDSFWMPYFLGDRLARAHNLDDAEIALPLLAKAEERVASQEPAESSRRSAWVNHAKATAWSRIFEYSGQPRAFAEVERLLPAIETRGERGWPSRDDVDSLRINTYYYAGELGKAEKVARDWVARSPESATARSHLAMVNLANLDLAAALKEARGGAKQMKDKDDDARFEIAMLELVSGTAGYEASARYLLEKTAHVYRDYIRLLLHWRLQREGRANHARALLDERWSRIDPSTWRERVNQGDVEVWREMLVGYFLGKVKWGDLSGPLADAAAFEKSPFSLLGMTLPSIRVEAHFYNALLQDVSGDSATRRARHRRELEQAAKHPQLHVYEYHMARYLLRISSK